jgi:hypothetical protein
MLAYDLAEFERVLQARDEIVYFFSARFSTSTPQTIPTLVIPEMGKTLLGVYLVRKDDLTDLVVKEVSKQNYWKIDSVISPAVEFDRCYHDETMVRRGRLYFHEGFFYDEADNWVEKPKEFISWANSLLRWIRSHYKRDPKTGFYVGPSAWEWASQQGGQLNPL